MARDRESRQSTEMRTWAKAIDLSTITLAGLGFDFGWSIGVRTRKLSTENDLIPMVLSSQIKRLRLRRLAVWQSPDSTAVPPACQPSPIGSMHPEL